MAHLSGFARTIRSKGYETRRLGQDEPVKYWEIVADKLTAGSSWGYCSAVTRDGWRGIVDAHREGRRYIVHSYELFSAFLELEAMLVRRDQPRFGIVYASRVHQLALSNELCVIEPT